MVTTKQRTKRPSLAEQEAGARSRAAFCRKMARLAQAEAKGRVKK